MTLLRFLSSCVGVLLSPLYLSSPADMSIAWRWLASSSSSSSTSASSSLWILSLPSPPPLPDLLHHPGWWSLVHPDRNWTRVPLGFWLHVSTTGWFFPVMAMAMTHGFCDIFQWHQCLICAAYSSVSNLTVRVGCLDLTNMDSPSAGHLSTLVLNNEGKKQGCSINIFFYII